MKQKPLHRLQAERDEIAKLEKQPCASLLLALGKESASPTELASRSAPQRVGQRKLAS